MKEIVVGKPTAIAQKRVEQQKLYVPRKDSMLRKVVGVILDDIRTFVFRQKAVIEDTPAGWEEYQRFLELAKGKR